MRWLLPIALLAAPAVSAAAVPHRYAVVLAVTVDAEGRLVEVKLSKVIDAESGSTDAVDVPVPPQWMEAARAWLAKREQPHEARTYFTYAFYDPARPGEVLTGKQ